MTPLTIFVAILVTQAIINILVIIWIYFTLRGMKQDIQTWLEEQIAQMQDSIAELIQRENSMLRATMMNLKNNALNGHHDKAIVQNRYVSFGCATAVRKDRSSSKTCIQVMDRDSRYCRMTTLFVLCRARPGYDGSVLEREEDLFIEAYNLLNERYRLPQAKDRPVLFLFPSPRGNMANNDTMVFNGIVMYGLKPTIEHIRDILIYSRDMQCMMDGICVTIDPSDLGGPRHTIRRSTVASSIAFHLKLADNERDNLAEFYLPC